MIKRTPQEIADFFQAYVAMDEVGRWYLYKEEPYIKGSVWIGEYVTSIENSLIKNNENTDWKKSLCKPSKINGSSDGETDTQLIRMLSNLILANIYTREYTKELHQIADHYGKRKLLEQLLIEGAEIPIVISHYLKGDSIEESLTMEIAELELLFEQVKYLMKIDPVDLGEIKKQKIVMRQLIIAKESHKESADNPQIVREKSTDEEEQG